MDGLSETRLYDKKESCCGCTACYSICPVHAISMIPDDEGFLYPEIDKNKCIDCHQCQKVCPFRKCKPNTSTHHH